MNTECVLWDWNGTLVDDVRIALASVNDMLTLHKLPNISLEDYHRFMDTDIRGFYTHIFDLDVVSYDTICQLFGEGYDRRLTDLGLMPHAIETVGALRRMGVRQAIVSMTHIDKLRRDSDAFGISPYMCELIGASDILVSSKAARAGELLERLCLDAGHTVVVGDMLHDLELAQALGARCVLIPNGHQSREMLEDSGAEVLDDISLVPEFIAGL